MFGNDQSAAACGGSAEIASPDTVAMIQGTIARVAQEHQRYSQLWPWARPDHGWGRGACAHCLCPLPCAAGNSMLRS